jgi:PAS domain S-box-containing protein
MHGRIGKSSAAKYAWLALITMWIVPASAFAPLLPPLTAKRVLILHSYYKGYRWTDDENRGIESVLQPELGAQNLYIEYMDTKRFWQPDYVRQFPEIYRRKYLYHHFDAIVATDNNAFDFLRQYRDELFPGTPVVFCGVNYFKDSDLAGHTLFTGVSEEADVKETLDLALRLHPATRHVYVVNEVSETGQAVHDELVRLLPQYAGRADIIFLEQYGLKEVEPILRNLPPDSLVLYTFLSRDGRGQSWEYDTAATAVAKASNAPVYGAWDFNLGYGIVGGKLISGFYQGEAAGKLALRVLRGENPDRIPVVRFSADRPNHFMFDYTQLRRYGIALEALPKGSIVVNMPESYFSRHRAAALAGGSALLLLAIMNTLLFLNVRRRKTAEGALREQQEHLEELVRKRSSELEDAMEALRGSQQLVSKTFASLRDAVLILEAETRVILDCNPAATKLFGFSREEIVGQTARQLHVDEESFRRFGELAQEGMREKGYLHLAKFAMMRKNGEVFPTRHSVMPLQAEDGTVGGWVSVIRDVTEEKKAEEKLEQYRRKLRALASELTAVEARERRSVAAQLHENLGQLLATAKMKVALLRTTAPDEALAPRMAEVQGLVEEALNQTRSLTYELSPPILYQLGLEAALKWLCESMEKRYGYRVVYTRQGESMTLPEENRVFLFSAVRELLVNVAKHAGASTVAVRVRWLEDQVEVLVRDDGKGFRRMGGGLPESQNAFGLFNIQERASDLGGRLWVRSEPDHGTAAKIHLPVDHPLASLSTESSDVNHEHKNPVG